MLDAFDAPFMQRALAESLLLAALAGVLGSWIVLRRLAFFTHGVGSAAFPGLVIAGALALGVVLASDVYETGAGVDRLLFGSLVGVSDRDLWLTAGVAAGVLVLEAVVRRSWLAQGFDPGTARALGVRPALADALLLGAVTAAAVVALDAVGALLVTAVLVIPAATVRLVAPSVGALQAGTALLAAAEGVVGLWLAYELNVGPGPATAVLGGIVFAVVAVLR
jgi:manganese/iron transport system permease protein